ncbi:hypothetical protein TC41_1456 [Alicyclobacillus acidocaldarius subsp. acidocaldarius Tc-4-1]|uniref:Uncharacterized protein n=1 Tax=Alicyclobacillus acidocaldarius (strain Tc-4-1) TaxID=1048834 RepID=F8IJ70_ALIAT|nr:hypothetical protein TC41_1456 [Alicyclobacillus acidocaldarius subsp. acidocaldarius Tc-4-1]
MSSGQGTEPGRDARTPPSSGTRVARRVQTHFKRLVELNLPSADPRNSRSLSRRCDIPFR